MLFDCVFIIWTYEKEKKTITKVNLEILSLERNISVTKEPLKSCKITLSHNLLFNTPVYYMPIYAIIA